MPTPEETRTAFEAALAEDPDDLASHMAYADLLAEQGDPRGEFIQTQLALEDSKLSVGERGALSAREGALLRRHGRDWLGEMAPHLLDQEGIAVYGEAYGLVFAFTWWRGWLGFVQVPDLTVPLAGKLSRCPAALLLRRLVVQRSYDEDADPDSFDPYGPPLAALHHAPFLSTLRAFQYGATPPEEFADLQEDDPFGLNPYDFIVVKGESVVPLVARMPHLEELRLLANDIDGAALFALGSLSRLRILQLCHSYDYPLEVLAANPAFANLTHLLLHPHAPDNNDMSFLPLDSVRAVLRSPHLKKLTHLQVRLSDMGDEGVREIISSGVLARLEELDLRHGRVTDAGARAIVAARPVKLRRLDLQRNRLTGDGMRTLRSAGIPELRVEHQQRPGPDGYTNAYLYEGDWE
jgi:uncharacterized protein (TIGR02996 family)